MQGLKVRCPNCTRISFETTDQYNPDLPPHGGMVRSLLQYQHDWLCTPTTKASEMACPECLGPLVVGGVLNVIMPAREVGFFLKADKTINPPISEEQAQKATVIKRPPCSQSPIFNALGLDNKDGRFDFVDTRTGEIVQPLKLTVNELQVPIRDNSPQAHMDGDKLNIVDPKNIKLICDICGKECKTPLGLQSHKRSHK